MSDASYKRCTSSDASNPVILTFETIDAKERNVFLYIRFNYDDIGSALDAPIFEFG